MRFLFLAGVSLGFAAVASATISFSTPLPIPVQDFPVAVAIACFDGSGADLVSANLNASSISYVRGHGDGTFDAPVHLAVGGQPRVLRAADLNGDGHLDIVAAQETGAPSLLVFLPGNGAGQFGAPVPVGTPAFPTALVAEDLDGDGDCDLAAALAGSALAHGGSIVVLLNDGQGHFTETLYLVADVETVYAADMHAGDFDRDSDLDLIVTLDLFFFNTVMTNDGNGAFTAGANLETTDLNVANEVADVDGDLDEDIVLIGLSRTLWVFSNDGTGSFTGSPVQTAPASVHIIGRFALADLDGDDRPEVVLPDPGVLNAGIVVSRNQGAGDFVFAGRFSAPGGQVPTFAATGDLDGSWPPDVVVADRATDQLVVFLGSAPTSVATSGIEDGGLRAFPSPLRPGQNVSIVASRPPRPSGVAEAGIVRLADVRGREVRAWSMPDGPEGWAIAWDGRDASGARVPAGIYFASAWSGSWSAGTKILVLDR